MCTFLTLSAGISQMRITSSLIGLTSLILSSRVMVILCTPWGQPGEAKIHSINSICKRRITSSSQLAWDKSLNISPAACLTKSLSSEPKNQLALMTLTPSRRQAWLQRSQASTKRYQWEFLRVYLSSFSVMLSAISSSAKFRNNLNFRIV